MTDQELDRWMRRVLLDSMEQRENKVAVMPAFAASARYHREIRSMLAEPMRWANKRARPVWKKALQRVAVVLLVFALSLGSLMAVSPTVRAAVIRWAVEWYENHITYRYSGEAIAEDMPRYEITALPEGYMKDESDCEEWLGYVFISYYNEELQKRIYLEYAYMQQGGAVDFFIRDDMSVLLVSVNGFEGRLFLLDDWEDNRNTVTWIDPNKNLQFTLHANLGKADILDMAESVSLVKTEK